MEERREVEEGVRRGGDMDGGGDTGGGGDDWP